MKKKNRNKIFVIAGIVILGFILCLRPFSKTEIIVLDHLTEINEDGVENQICLVKNPPNSSTDLEDEIAAFNNAHAAKGKYCRRLFIKEHDKTWFSALSLHKTVDYESRKITRNDLDNIDFLADSKYELTNDGKVLREINVRTGDLWYYK